MSRAPACRRALVLAGCLALASVPAAGVPLPFPLVHQETSQWCWAATAEMILRGLEAPPGPYSQRNQVTRLHAVEQCPKTLCSVYGETSEGCLVTGFPQFYKFGFDAEVTGPLMWLDWDWLERELRCKPMAFAWEFVDASGALTGRGHMVVLADAREVELDLGGVRVPLGSLIAVNDPKSTFHPDGFSSGVFCSANRRIWTYSHYRSLRPWIHYYGFRETGEPLPACSEADSLAQAARWMSMEEEVAAAPGASNDLLAEQPELVVTAFLDALEDAESADDDIRWLLAAAGIEDADGWHCDLERPLIRESVALVGVDPESRPDLDRLAFETGMLRFLCADASGSRFSIEVERASDTSWHLASFGDKALAGALDDARQVFERDFPGFELRETEIQGINQILLRRRGLLPGDPGEVIEITPFEELDGWSDWLGSDREWFSPEGSFPRFPSFEVIVPPADPRDPWTTPRNPWLDLTDGLPELSNPRVLLPELLDAAESLDLRGPS